MRSSAASASAALRRPAPRRARTARAREPRAAARRPACCAAPQGQSAATRAAAACVALALLLAPSHAARAEQEALIADVPSALSSADSAPLGGESRSSKLRGKNSKAVANCASQCITTCTRGGPGAPGLGPLAQRGELVVFKPGFRSRLYCVNECVDACARLWSGPPAAPR